MTLFTSRLSNSVLNRSHFMKAGIYLFKVNNGHIRTMCKILTKLTQTPERRRRNLFFTKVWSLWLYLKRDSDDVVFVSLILTLNSIYTLFWCFHYWLWTSKFIFNNFIINFEQNIVWNLLKVKPKDTRSTSLTSSLTSFWRLCCWLYWCLYYNALILCPSRN